MSIEGNRFEIISVEGLKLVPSLIAVVSATSVIFSMVANWIYFEIVMPEAFGFLTINDEFSFALRWVPFSALYVFLGGLIGNSIGKNLKRPDASTSRDRSQQSAKVSFISIFLVSFLFFCRCYLQLTTIIFTHFLFFISCFCAIF